MNAERVLKSTQEQATAAWVDYLNQLRLNELLEKLFTQDVNLEQALEMLRQTKLDIAKLLDADRGGIKGAHGFIAEAAEAGIGNARNLLHGLPKIYQWINDNGPADLLRGDTEIQQKFVRAGGHFGLEAVREHLKKYPDFLRNGGKYQIPKDFYQKIEYLLSLSGEQAAKESNQTYRLWKWVRCFFEESGVKPSDLEPSSLKYSQVQLDAIDATLEETTGEIKVEDQKIRDKAYQDSRPSAGQAAQTAAVGAALEGGMAFCLGVVKKRKQGKKLSEFTAQDWKEIGLNTSGETIKGAVRGVTVYALSNFTATPAPVGSALVTAAFGVTAQARQLHRGSISAEEFIVNSEALCLEVSVSALSSVLGQVVIPVPLLGALIGNTVGMFLYQIACDCLSKQEQELIRRYRMDIDALEKKNERELRALIEQLNAKFAQYSSLVQAAFSEEINAKEAFEASVQLADYVGVSPEKSLRNKQDLDNFFMS